MTLIACWSEPAGLKCASDSRLTRNDESVLTEAGGKLFTIPVKCKYLVEEGKWGNDFSYTLGFAFAGSTLLANNTHALASTLTQQLTSKETGDVPSAKTVANIYCFVAEYVIKDRNMREHTAGRLYFEALIFGYCPVEKTFVCHCIKHEITDNSFSMKVESWHEKGPFMGTIGDSSARANFITKVYRKNAAGNHPDPLHTFRDVIEDENISTVGGAVQVAISEKDGTSIYPLLTADEKNPDSIILSLAGLDVTYGMDGFAFFMKSIELGLEKFMGRLALKNKGLDPDERVPQKTQNLASMEEGLRQVHGTGQSLKIDDQCTIDSVKPVMAGHYVSAICKSCKKTTPLMLAPRGFDKSKIRGNGSLISICWHCKLPVCASPGSYEMQTWNLPTL